MHRTSLVLLLICVSASSCEEGHGQVTAAPPRPATFALDLGPGRTPSAHSWDGVTSVPWTSARDARSLEYGEAGRTPLTGLYLTFEGDDVRDELRIQPDGWTAEARNVKTADGRFGRGGRLERDSLLTCTLPEPAPEARVWSIECWLRAPSLRAGVLFELPGFLQVSMDGKGRIFARVPGAGQEERAEGGFDDLVIGTAATLTAGEWSHLGVVLDLFELRAVRIVLDGAVEGRRFEVARLPGTPRELLVGDAPGVGRGAAVSLDELRVEQRNVATAELAERWQAKPRPLEHLTLEFADGAREELDVWTAPLSEPWIASAAGWNRGELAHAFADDTGLAWTPESWRRIHTAARPLARTTHSTAGIGGQRVLVYGGETRDTHFGRILNTDDTWVFDGADERWTRVPTTRAPSGRCHVPMVYSPDHDLVLLVGGWLNERVPGENYGDTWVYRVAAEDWEPRSSEGLTMRTTTDHALVYLPQRRCFLLMSSTGNFAYDPEAERWAKLPPPSIVDERGEPAEDPPRYSRSAAVDARGVILLFGGYGAEVFLDTTALFDVETNTITVLDPPVRPVARVRPAFTYDPLRDRFVMFGGVRDQASERYRDLWVFEPATRTWREIPEGQGRPSARGGYYGMGYDAVADRFVVTHGRHALDRFLDETWVLALDEREPGRARHLFDRRDLGLARNWRAEVETPGDSRVTFRFRGSEDPLRLGEWRAEPPAAARYVEVETELVPGTDGAVPRVRAMGFRASL